MRFILIALLLVSSLSACSVQVHDERISREEIAQAFKARDSILKGIVTSIKELKEGAKKK